jgi:two-component sensor histidine kinase
VEETLHRHEQLSWRQALLNKTLFVVVMAGTLALVPSVIMSVVTEKWVVLAIDLVGWTLAALLSIARRLPFHLRAWGLIAVLDVVSAVLFLELGPIPASMLWLFGGVALAQLLLERIGLIVAGVAALALLTVLGVLNRLGLLGWEVGTAVWLVQIANFAAVSAGVAAATGFLVKRIEDSLQREHSLLNVLASRHGEMRASHEALQKEHARQEHLVHELHHRVRNNLQTLSSLLELDCPATSKCATDNVIATFRGRIASIAGAHEALSTSSSMDRVDADALIRAVVAETVSTAPDLPSAPALTVQGDQRLTLTSGEAVPLALICHEWLQSILQSCTKANAKIAISYSAEPGRHVALEVFAASALVTHLEARLSTERGEVVESLAHQIRAHIRIGRFESHLQCALRLPSPSD